MTISKAIFPMAGLGTRFLPATKAMPKELLPIVDKPLIQYAIEEAINAGCKDLIFIVGKNERAIKEYFYEDHQLINYLNKRGRTKAKELIKNIVTPDIKLTFVKQSEPKGLGHAVCCAAPYVGNNPSFVILADDYIKTDASNPSPCDQLADGFRKKKESHICLVKVKNKDISKYGIADINKKNRKVKNIIEKPHPSMAPSNMAAIGRYLLTSSVFEQLAKLAPGFGGEIQLTDALQKIAKQDKLSYCHFLGSRFDCGNKLGYLHAIVRTALTDKAHKVDFEKILYQELEQRDPA